MEDVTKIRQTILVFASNRQGKHGKGSALLAKRKWGAKQGVGVGRTGNSYAIPTREIRDGKFFTLDIHQIREYVEEFLEYAMKNPHLDFKIVPIGCGNAGYLPKYMAPLFLGAPKNCILPAEFITELEMITPARDVQS